MEKKSNFRKYILGTNWFKTILINFHYFPFKVAFRLPILVSYHTVFQTLKGGGGGINGPISKGMLLLGYHNLGFQDPLHNRTVWDVSGNIQLNGSKINIGRGSKICVYGTCIFGNQFTITGQSTLICAYNITFGNNVLLAWDIIVMDTDFHKILSDKGDRINGDRKIIVGDDVWIGCRATILKGSIIPSNSVIAACSVYSGVMNKDGCIISSNKVVLKDSITWMR